MEVIHIKFPQEKSVRKSQAVERRVVKMRQKVGLCKTNFGAYPTESNDELAQYQSPMRNWLCLFCKNDLNAELDRCYRRLFIGKLIVRVREASNARSLAFNGIGGVGIATHGFFLPNVDRDVDRKY